MLPLEYLNFANENPACFIATADDDQPRVRGFLLWFADESGLYYHTSLTKDVCRQLIKNPKTELCFYSSSAEPNGKMMRITGSAEFLDNPALNDRLITERPWLTAIGKEQAESMLAIFRIAHGEARFWTIKDNMREAEVNKVIF